MSASHKDVRILRGQTNKSRRLFSSSNYCTNLEYIMVASVEKKKKNAFLYNCSITEKPGYKKKGVTSDKIKFFLGSFMFLIKSINCKSNSLKAKLHCRASLRPATLRTVFNVKFTPFLVNAECCNVGSPVTLPSLKRKVNSLEEEKTTREVLEMSKYV